MPDGVRWAHGRGHRGSNRVIRGGSWNSNARNVRAAYRNHNDPSNRWNNLGFRLARAQTWAGRPAPDPAGVRSGRAAGRSRPANIPSGHRYAGRALARDAGKRREG